MTLGERIRNLRRSRDWTQGELEDRAGVPQFFGSSILLGSDGKKQLEPTHIEAIAKALGIPLVDLLSGLDEPEPTLEQAPHDGAITATGENPNPEEWRSSPYGPLSLTNPLGPLSVIVEQGEQETLVTHSTATMNGRDERTGVIDRQISAHTFAAPPARVGAEFRVSFQVSNEEWTGVRVWTERPCELEDVEAAREAVINETRAALDHQHRRLLHDAAAAYRREQPGLRIVDSADPGAGAFDFTKSLS